MNIFEQIRAGLQRNLEAGISTVADAITTGWGDPAGTTATDIQTTLLDVAATTTDAADTATAAETAAAAVKVGIVEGFAEGSTTGADIDVYDTMAAIKDLAAESGYTRASFTSTGTWTKPAGDIKEVIVVLFSGGNNGVTGQPGDNTATGSYGAAGGLGGGHKAQAIDPATFSALHITVGAANGGATRVRLETSGGTLVAEALVGTGGAMATAFGYGESNSAAGNGGAGGNGRGADGETGVGAGYPGTAGESTPGATGGTAGSGATSTQDGTNGGAGGAVSVDAIVPCGGAGGGGAQGGGSHQPFQIEGHLGGVGGAGGFPGGGGGGGGGGGWGTNSGLWGAGGAGGAGAAGLVLVFYR